jgi:UDP-glucose 4-epimerase
MRVLVVGGAGYIGSVVTRILQETGHEPVVFDNLSKGHQAALPPNCRFISGNMCSSDDLARAFAEDVEAVMHFGAFIQVGESVHDPALYFNNNLAGSMVLFDSMRKFNVKKIIFSSTAAVYGEPESSPITEVFALQPTSPYGETKLSVEKVLKWYSQAYDLRYVSLRYFNAAGAYKDAGEDHDPESHLIPLLLQVANGTRQNVTIYGDDYDTPDGTCIRDYVHVRDLADAHRRSLLYLQEGNTSDVFNLGSGTGASVREIVSAVEEVTGKTIPTVTGSRRAGDPAALVASNQRIQDRLGWKPAHSTLNEIISDAWRWKMSHPNGYRN